MPKFEALIAKGGVAATRQTWQQQLEIMRAWSAQHNSYLERRRLNGR